MVKKPEYIFVYGTLRKEANFPAYTKFAELAAYHSAATVQGRLYMIDWYPGLILSDNPDDIVQGDLFLTSTPDLALKYLDSYEECTAQHPEPWEYCRKKIKTVDKNGQEHAAWVYLYNRDTKTKTLIESGDFLSR